MSTSSPVWHPFTQHGLIPEMIEIAAARGAYLKTADGRRLIDAIASWWVVTHGHGHPPIVAAIQNQAAILDQVIFAGFTHQPAEDLARELIRLAPPGLAHVFYSDSGSIAVEVALKMTLGYWHHMGAPERNRIVVMEHGYHGDTVGAMSVGQRGVFNRPYDPLLFDVETIPFPRAGAEDRTLAALETLCRVHAGRVAALLVEPLVLGAGGMRMYGAATLGALKRICEANDIVFIADEVMTGWGRTGTVFACEQAGVSPDILCTAKGITGGALPLAATLCQPRFFDAHFGTDRARTFFHGSSYTANPIACAAARANIETWKTEPVAERIAALGRAQGRQLERLAGDKRFMNPRRTGTIAAVDLAVGDAGYLSDIGPRLYRYFIDRGLLLRPLGNTIYVLPPYATSEADLEEIYDAIATAPDALGL